jgi:hypothetical protein
MSHQKVSMDEYLSSQKGAVKGGNTVLKAFKSPSSWSPETRSCVFTVSAEVEDRDKDIIYQEGLDFSEFLKNPTALMFHNGRSWPIGKWSDIAPNLSGRPKRTEGKLTVLPEGVEPDADRAARHVEHGTLKTVSIGFIPKEIERREVPQDKRDGYYYPGYHIRSAEIVEISLVPIPSLRQALAKDSGDAMAMPRDVISEFLDGFCKMPSGIVVPVEDVAKWEKAYLERSGNPSSVVVSKDAGHDGGVFKSTNEPPVIVVSESIVTPDESETMRRQIKEATESKRIEDTLFERMVDWAAKHFGKKAEPEPTPIPMTAEEKARVLADADDAASKARAA